MGCLESSGIILLIFYFQMTSAYYYRVPVGIIVGKDDSAYLSAIKYAISIYQSNNSSPYAIDLQVEKIGSDDIYQMDRAVCKILSRGVFALMAPTTYTTYNTLASYSNNFHLPLISPSFPEVPLEQTMKYGLAILPSPIRATLDVMRYNQWNSIIYLYDTEDGAENFQKLLLLSADIYQINVIGMHRTTNVEDAVTYLRKIDIANRKIKKQILLKTEETLTRDIITMFLHDVHIGKDKYNFLYMNPVLNSFWENSSLAFRSVNLTGFRLTNSRNEGYVQFKHGLNHFDKNITMSKGKEMEAVLGYDGALLLMSAIDHLMRNQYRTTGVHISAIINGTQKQCFQGYSSYWDYGYMVSEYLKEVSMSSAITGNLQFDPNGQRRSYTLEIMQTFRSGYVKVGSWSDTVGLRVTRSSESHPISSRLSTDKPLIVTTIESDPFLMVKTDPQYTGNDRFEGFCKDLTDLLTQELGVKYVMHLVADRKYGVINPNNGKWSGMIGEVINGDADIAVAPLTVTTTRSGVVRFSQPFQTLGISLMLKKPGSKDISPLETTPFFFLYVFTKEVWICIIVTYVVITALLFIVTKFTGSPDRSKLYEASPKQPSICSTMWFTMGSCLLRGTGIYPKSISARVLSCIWWAFTLTIISLYIANAATLLVAHRIGGEGGANNAALSTRGIHGVLEDAVNSGTPELGFQLGGSTMEFFKNAKLPLYKKIYDMQQQKPSLGFQSPKEAIKRVRESNGKFGALVESAGNEYISHREPCDTIMVQGTLDTKGYAVASQLNSDLGDRIDTALQKLQETGQINQLYDKWWLRTSECARRYTRNMQELYHDSLTISEVSGVFYVLLIGVAAIMAITAAEYFYCTRHNSSRRNKSTLDETQT